MQNLPKATPLMFLETLSRLQKRKYPKRDFKLVYILFFLIFKNFIYSFLERERERKRGRETSMSERSIDQLPLEPGTEPTTLACALIRNRTSDPLLCR